MNLRDNINLYRRYFNWQRAGCIFIHVPKAAGTSINYALYGRTLGHYTIGEISSRFPGLVERCLVFSMVRNPYDRLVSAYEFARKGRTEDMGIAKPEQYRIEEFATFPSFVRDWLAPRDLASLDHVFRPQHLYVCLGDMPAVDYLGRVETLAADMAEISNRLGRHLQVQERNRVVKQMDYRDYYDASLAELVYGLYRKDFEILGYDRKL